LKLSAKTILSTENFCHLTSCLELSRTPENIEEFCELGDYDSQIGFSELHELFSMIQRPYPTHVDKCLLGEIVVPIYQ